MSEETEVKEEKELTPQQQVQIKLSEKKDFLQAILPKHVDIERFMKSATLAAVRNPELLKCTMNSVITACINAAEVGLDFTPAKGHAFLVPYKGKAEFIPGYRGLIHLILLSGEIENIEAVVVYKNDKFEYARGLTPKLEHCPALDNPGPAIGAYAIAWFKSGKPQYEYMTEAQINHVKKRSKSQNSEYSPWNTDPDEMRKKTVIRRLFKVLPSSVDNERFVKAIESDNEAFGLLDIPFENVPEESRSATENIMNTLKKDDLKDPKQEDLELK